MKLIRSFTTVSFLFALPSPLFTIKNCWLVVNLSSLVTLCSLKKINITCQACEVKLKFFCFFSVSFLVVDIQHLCGTRHLPLPPPTLLCSLGYTLLLLQWTLLPRTYQLNACSQDETAFLCISLYLIAHVPASSSSILLIC